MSEERVDKLVAVGTGVASGHRTDPSRRVYRKRHAKHLWLNSDEYHSFESYDNCEQF